MSGDLGGGSASGKTRDIRLRVTIAICTRNRAELLRRTVGSLTDVAVPAEISLEIVVVDNNSTDDTASIVGSFADRLPLRYELEPEPGLSVARNHAVRVATGDYIIWIDDDVVVDRQWLQSYCRAFARWPDATIFGGPIEPLFASEPPDWLRRTIDQVSGPLSLRDLGSVFKPLTRWEEPFGANMAFRAEPLRMYPFDPSLGVSATRAGSSVLGEETRVIHAMFDDGLTGWWVPDARLKHEVGAQRMTTSYLRAKAVGWGKYVARSRGGEEPPPRLPPWPVWRRAAVGEVRYRVHRLRSEPEVWVHHLLVSGQRWGELLGAARGNR